MYVAADDVDACGLMLSDPEEYGLEDEDDSEAEYELLLDEA